MLQPTGDDRTAADSTDYAASYAHDQADDAAVPLCQAVEGTPDDDEAADYDAPCEVTDTGYSMSLSLRIDSGEHCDPLEAINEIAMRLKAIQRRVYGAGA